MNECVGYRTDEPGVNEQYRWGQLVHSCMQSAMLSVLDLHCWSECHRDGNVWYSIIAHLEVGRKQRERERGNTRYTPQRNGPSDHFL